MTANGGASKRGHLTRSELAAAADMLGCDVPAIQAFASVETGPWGAWLSTGHPAILFERHLFRRLTGGKYDHDSEISNATPGGYGRALDQPDRLIRAKRYDVNAAIMATSWGMFQILGMHHRICGFHGPEAFEASMHESVFHHLHAFVCFIRADERLCKAIVVHDWTTAARRYNGPQHEKHNYAGRLERQYQRFIQEMQEA